MSRKAVFRKGGGFLNGVTGTITDYQFTDEFNGKAFVPGRNPTTKKEKFHSLYVALSVRVDGAEEDVVSHLFAGGFEDFEVSEDGHSLTPIQDGYVLGGNTAWSKFVESYDGLAEGGAQSEDEDVINYEPLIGERVTLTQVENEADTKKLGRVKDKKDPTKSYPRKDLLVTEVFDREEEEVAPAKAAKGAKGKAAPVKATGKASKPNGSTKTTPAEDLDELASATLVTILQKAAGNSIKKSQLSMKVLNALMAHPAREAVRKLISSEDFLGLEAGWGYDTDAGVVTLEAE